MSEHNEPTETPVQPGDAAAQTADSLLAKLRTFVREELDDDERAAFAVLLAPALVDLASGPADDVAGFGVTGVGVTDVSIGEWGDPADRWAPGPLPDQLARAVRAGRLRVVVDE